MNGLVLGSLFDHGSDWFQFLQELSRTCEDYTAHDVRDLIFPLHYVNLLTVLLIKLSDDLLIFSQPLALEANHAKAISFLRDAALQGCHLAVLPEYHLTNWLPEDPGFILLCAQYQKYLDSYCSLAKELNMCIVPGTIVEKHDDDLLNIAYFISNDGLILGQYQKKNLWHPERPHLTSKHNWTQSYLSDLPLTLRHSFSSHVLPKQLQGGLIHPISRKVSNYGNANSSIIQALCTIHTRLLTLLWVKLAC
jgi:hypothetical protein